MQQFNLEITTADGTKHGCFGMAGSGGHQEALRIRDNWRDLATRTPRHYVTLGGPDDKPINIFADQITDVVVRVGDEY